MNPDDESKVGSKVGRTPGPGDLDPSAIVAISMSLDEFTFASYDRASYVTVSGNQLRELRDYMTVSEWRELDRKVKGAVSSGSSEIGFATPPASSVPTSAPNPKFTVPPSTVSETLAAQAASDGSPAAIAKTVMNALTKMGATSDDALAIILAEIEASDDPFKASGDWIAKITNAANAVVKEVEGDEQ